MAVVKYLEALIILDHVFHPYLRSRWIIPSFVSILGYVYTVYKYVYWDTYIYILIRHGMPEVYETIMKCVILNLLPVFIRHILDYCMLATVIKRPRTHTVYCLKASQSCPFTYICCCTVAVVKNLEALVLDHAIHTYLRSRWIVPSFVSILEYVYTVIYILVRHGMPEVYGNIMNVEF